ncbi:MAG: hypothetical protein IPJ65_32500 [Archangiaceae bacterium]|nr:hypothetical protein [Archangiaceae bacterium]
MARRRKPNAAQRVRQLIALDGAKVMKRLQSRQTEMVRLFSRLRDRSPLLEVVDSWFQSITFTELSALDPHEQRAVTTFYELLGELRWYLQYTEDMPLQVQQRVTKFVHELRAAHRALTSVIGPPDGEGTPVVEAQVVRPLAR